MVDKIFITNKLDNFFRTTNIDSFLKVLLISFLYDKTNYIEKVVGTEGALNMLDKYISNLSHNLKSFFKLNTYHSIYAEYEYKTKQLKYYITNEYNKIDKIKLDKQEKKQLIIQEFKIMMYKEIEKIINIYSLNGKIISNGFYMTDLYGRYPEYDGDFSDIIDIFSDVETRRLFSSSVLRNSKPGVTKSDIKPEPIMNTSTVFKVCLLARSSSIFSNEQ